ncbi:alpha/beta hydrolase [Cyanobacteria bacterium FACHB-471]|nr:alpha/beta hydrolase [Cyanobacteria bacterium FACHB-471]
MVKTVDVLGVPHAYELTPPRDSSVVLVFVHGWLLSREYWRPTIQQLSPHYQCLSYDLRGFGHSQAVTPKPFNQASSPQMSAAEQNSSSDRSTQFDRVQPDGTSSVAQSSVLKQNATLTVPSRYAPAAYAQDLTVLLEQLEISTAWLVGHSLGGSISLWAADQLPQKIRGVVCVNSGGGIYLKEEFERFRAAGQQLVKLRPRWLCRLPLLDLPMSRMNVARPLTRQWGKQRLVDWVAAHPEAALGTLLDSTTETEVHSLPQVVSRLQQPVYFIAGAEDTIMEPQYVRHLASFHPSFECCGNNVVEIPDCGHLAMVEQPEEVAAQIQRIVAKHEF